jgi:hypothetical protein
MVGRLIRRPLPPVSDFIRTLLDDPDATTALATLGITSGTYTPTLTAGANVAASTAFLSQYIRIGDRVIVTGRADIDATAAAATGTNFEISLPVASDFSATDGQCNGVFSIALASGGGFIQANSASNRAYVTYYSGTTTNIPGVYYFMYTVI